MKPTFLSIKNFDKFQHYKHRNPPWIKLYYDILDDDEFILLSIPSRHHYMTLLLIAGRKNNRIPHDAAYLKKVMRLDEEPDLTELIERGFLLASRKHAAGRLLATCNQNALSEAEAETEKSEIEAEAERVCVGDQGSPALMTRYEGKLSEALQKEFEIFYALYPFKKNRKDAEREWYYARRVASAETIMEGLKRAIESEDWTTADRDGRLCIPHPQRFLQKQRWLDDWKKKREGGKFGAGFDEFLKAGKGG